MVSIAALLVVELAVEELALALEKALLDLELALDVIALDLELEEVPLDLELELEREREELLLNFELALAALLAAALLFGRARVRMLNAADAPESLPAVSNAVIV